MVCLIDPVGDVYACPFVIDPNSWPATCADRVDLPPSARERAVPVAAGAAERRGLRLVRFVRCLPGRVHGGQILHGPAAGRARPRMRLRPWRDRARRGDPPTPGRGSPWGTQKSTRAARRSPCRPLSDFAHQPGSSAAALVGRRCRSRVPPGPRSRPPIESKLLAIPVGSLEQHGPHLPLNTDTRIATDLAARLCALRRDVMMAPPAALRGQRRALRGFPGPCCSTTRSWPPSWSSWCDRPEQPSPE